VGDDASLDVCRRLASTAAHLPLLLVLSFRPVRIRQRRSHLWAVTREIPISGGDMRDRATCADTLDQQPPAVNGQPGITVGHEDLRAVQS
jgi:hypothetical protein